MPMNSTWNSNCILSLVQTIALVANRFRLRSVFGPLSVLWFLSLSVFAQQATIVGTVTDPSGASLANVNITVINLESGVAKKIQTNAAGQYVVPDLNIGHY